MLRRYSHDQVVDKLGIDDAELGFLIHQFREFLSSSDTDQQLQNFSEQDVILLTRAFRLLREEGQDPAVIRAAMQDELSGTQTSGLRQANIVAFCSGRTGTGKSVVLYNIASALAERGSRCAIFDGSSPLGGKSHFASTHGRTWIQTLDSGVSLISGEMLLQAMASGADAGQAPWEDQLNDIGSTSDFILVDVGPGRSDNALRYAMVVDETIIVTTTDVGSNTDCFSVIRMLRDVDPGLSISLILNRAASLSEARESFARINGAAGKLAMGEIYGLGWVAEDEALRACASEGQAVVDRLPTSISARCIGRIADHLIHRLTPVKRSNSGGIHVLALALRSAMEREATVTDKI